MFDIQAPRNAVWLADLPEQNARVARGMFGKHGELGYEGKQIRHKRQSSPHGLSMPPDGAEVTYSLGKKSRTFRAVAAMDDTALSERPAVFSVFCDGYLSWISCAMKRRGEWQECIVDVTGVDKLKLRVDFHVRMHGHEHFAHAVWLEPYVDPAPFPAAGEVPVRSAAAAIEWGRMTNDLPQRTRTLFQEAKYDELEKLRLHLIENGRIIENFPELAFSYVGLSEPGGQDEANCSDLRKSIREWRKACPDSYLAQYVERRAYVLYAWSARGDGWAGSVTAKGWELFRERLEKARELLEPLFTRPERDSFRYFTSISLGMGQGWPDDRVRRLWSIRSRRFEDLSYLAFALRARAWRKT